MKTQPISKFEGVTVDLSIEEAISFAEGDPHVIDLARDHISGHLNAARISFKEEKEKVAGEKKPDVKCEFCGKMFFSRGMKLHRRKCLEQRAPLNGSLE